MYKQIPNNAELIKCDTHWCGDDYCNCHYVEIYVYKTKRPGDKWPHWIADGKMYRCGSLWYSSYMSGPLNKSELEEMRQETIEACEHYGIKYDVSDDCFWDWEFEDKIL